MTAPIRTLLIDDEPLARRHLRALVARHPRLAVAGEAATFEQARTLLDAADHDLVLLDIQLRGGNGLDLVPHVRVGARIIFITAFDRHAVRAFEVNALDYLLKPVSAERFAAALARLAPPGPSAANDPEREPREDAAARPFSADDTVFVRTEAGDRFVPVLDIAAVLSNSNYSDVHLRGGERLFTRRTLKSWETLLPATHFMRVHRQALVNLGRIRSHRADTRETLELKIEGVPAPVGVSRHSVADLLARLGTA